MTLLLDFRYLNESNGPKENRNKTLHDDAVPENFIGLYTEINNVFSEVKYNL